MMPFEFLGYEFDEKSLRAIFRYRGGTAENPLEFVKIATFSNRALKTSQNTSFSPEKRALLARALFLSYIINGTSYYKAFPSREVRLPFLIDQTQADFFNAIYQEGLSQFAYENKLKREDLAHFIATSDIPQSISDIKESTDEIRTTISGIRTTISDIKKTTSGIITLQSGGKDSLLTAAILNESHTPWTALYVSTSGAYPKIIDEVGAKDVEIINRDIDLKALKNAEALGGKNGHVPVTYINISLALIQAIIDDKDTILTSIGHEGEEPHSIIKSTEKDLLVNHQWSKTAEAEKLLQDYVKNYVSPKFQIFSPLRKYSELKIAKLFVEKCWQTFGHKFSSCNVINYGQRTDNSELKWCGRCAKCANSYLLFAPFLKPQELNSLFKDNHGLFEIPELTDDFKGLLGIDNNLKPFECVGEVAELRRAYHMKQPGYPDLPFSVPDSDFDYDKPY